MDGNDLQIRIRPATSEDLDLVYDIKRETLREYVEQTWGWNEEWQQAFHASHFRPEDTKIIVVDKVEIGTVVIKQGDDSVWLESLYILPQYQNRGIGSHFIKQAIATASNAQLPLRLKVLTVNPARKLYQRFGCLDIEQTKEHYIMERPAE